MIRESMDGNPMFSLDQHGVCKGCASGKYAKTIFPSSDSRSKGILDLIHLDVYGPMSIVSIGGDSYYVTFIDDYSRKTCIYFINTKDEVFIQFQGFNILWRTKWEEKLRCLDQIMEESIPRVYSRSYVKIQELRES